MKFLYFGDMHERADTPRSRLDDYQSTLDAKAAEIKQIAKENHVSAMLHPGDFLDTPKQKDETIVKILKRWSTVDTQELCVKVATGAVNANELYEQFKQNLPLVGAIGNHELFGGSKRAFDKTSIAFLIKTGFMSHPTIDEPLIFTDEDGCTIAVTVADYTLDIDKDPSHSAYIVKQKAADYHIHIVHGYGTVQNFGTLIPHTKVDDFKKQTKADLTIIGHDHIGFDPIEFEGKWFVNPGSPVRLTCNEKEMQRQPKVMLIELTQAKGIQLTMIPLQSAKAAKEVYDLNTKDHEKAIEKNLKKIENLVHEATKKVESTDLIDEKLIRQIVIDIAKEAEVNDAVLEPMLKRLDEKIAANPHHISVGKPYKIKKMTLDNFQSHAHSVYEFSNHMNVLTGPSGSGKTSVFRALRWIYTDCDISAKRYIRYGEKAASVKIELDDGTTIERKVEKKANGFNGYIVTDPNGVETKSNTKGIKMIQDLLGYHPLDIDSKKTVEINFLKQGASWFFIGSDTTGSDRAKIIGNIYGTEYADACIKELEADGKKQALLLKSKDDELKEVEQQILLFPDLEQAKEKIDTLQSLFDLVERNEETLRVLTASQETLTCLNKKIAILADLIENRTQTIDLVRSHILRCIELNRSIDELQKEERTLNSIRQRGSMAHRIATQLQQCEQATTLITQARNRQIERQILEVDQKRIHAIIVAGTRCKKVIQALAPVPEAERLLSKSRNSLNESVDLFEHSKVLKQSESKALGCLKIMERFASVQEANTLIETIKKYQLDLTETVESYNKLKSYNQVIVNCKNKAKAQMDEIIRLKQEYMEEFGKIDLCPLCRQKLDRDVIIKIGKEVLNNPMTTRKEN